MVANAHLEAPMKQAYCDVCQRVRLEFVPYGNNDHFPVEARPRLAIEAEEIHAVPDSLLTCDAVPSIAVRAGKWANRRLVASGQEEGVRARFGVRGVSVWLPHTREQCAARMAKKSEPAPP